MELAETVKLIGKRWNILIKLAEKNYYVSQLAEELGKKTSQISNELKELEKNGLVEYEQKEGERRKYYRPSEGAKMILTAVTQATQLKAKGKLEEWQMNEWLSMLEDQSLSDDLRLSYSESFHGICDEYPTEVLGNSGARSLLEKVAADRLHDKVTEDLKRSVSAILTHASRLENWGKWVLEKLYPVFVKNMEDENENIRLWAIKMVGKIAVSGIGRSVKNKFEEKLLKIWFSSNTDPDSKVGAEVTQQLVGLFSRRLFEDVRARTGNQKDKGKAEILLEKLKDYLKPR